MNSEILLKNLMLVLFDSMIEVTEIMDSFNIISLNLVLFLDMLEKEHYFHGIELCTYSNDNFKKNKKSYG